jgi:plasmid stabilization system protein ParE
VISRTPYIAVYVVDGETVAVVRIIHGRQRWPPADDEA